MARRVTIRDIARAAGVSKTAVSFAFNDPERLSRTTLEKILRVAEEMGYQPHPLARGLSTRRTGIVGVLIPQEPATVLENPFFIQFLQGISQVCSEEGLLTLLAPPLQGSLRQAVNQAVVDGFLVLGLDPDDPILRLLGQRQIPFVLVDSDPTPHVPSVNVSDREGARAAMAHLLELGHRRIAILAFESRWGDWRRWTGTLARRLQGYAEALAAAGLSLESPQVRILEAENTLEGGAQAFQRLWSSAPRPTAVAAMSDVLALGVIQGAREAGVSVPGELSVVGFDDVPEALLATPPLTTVRQPSIEKGALAVELLIGHLNGTGEGVEHRLLPTELVVRGSTAPVPRQAC